MYNIAKDYLIRNPIESDTVDSIVLMALNKQIPVKWNKEENKVYDVDKTYYKCPECDTQYGEEVPDSCYCYKCGQRLEL